MIKWMPYVMNMTGILIWLKIRSRKLTNGSYWQLSTIFSAIGYLVIVGYLTLAPTSEAFLGKQQVVPFMIGTVPVNLIPFWSTTADFYQNVLLMLPMGIYIALLRPTSKIKIAFFAGLMISFGIEAMQFVLDLVVGLSRWVDVNDVLTNTVGVLIGWLLIALMKRTKLNRLVWRFSIDFLGLTRKGGR
ncbi:VanZ family protein [Lentilactobacillus raoultii]|uniref:VanZ family protein n=1 Tax=Lentilactobacillus raoultii TaxID=1987503 RepID=A0ABW3PJ03_9LACO|nr:VanZ family protein [Lentilactobacillus raoultii]